MKQYLIFGLLMVLVSSCKKYIDFNLQETEPKLVVEATVENGEYPLVLLTRSIGYFSTIGPEALAKSFERNAEVTVSNGSTTMQLKEYAVRITPAISFYYYAVDSNNMAAAFKGQFNTTYQLKVKTVGKEYLATTSIPTVTKRVDSLWWKPAIAIADSAKAAVIVRITDRPGFGDYIRYLTKTGSQPFLPPYNSAYDDLFIDGTTYELQLAPGIDRNVGDRESFLFNRGDTITFKLSNIDKTTYEFWRTLEFSYGSIGNPFSTPTKVLSNISNGALGYFGGYATQYRTLIIPK
ncbi:MAG: DUF4249 domain-containing protein [Bacteroidota bacterium]